MKNILARANREILQQFAWSNVLLAFDFDGTLAPIVSVPDQARMRPSTHRLLETVTRRYPCIVISGRSQADARKHLRGINVLEVVGNHGLEPWKGSRSFKMEVERWRPMLEQRLSAQRGVVIEHKTFSISVHYRQSREKKRARAAILEAAAALGDVRVIGGKLVVNILPRGAPDKGSALERERERLSCDTAIYIGDDETDEDVFALNQPGRLLTIRVGSKRTSLANYCVESQACVDDFLRLLIELRSRDELRKVVR